jgi:hypothetical protein
MSEPRHQREQPGRAGVEWTGAVRTPADRRPFDTRYAAILGVIVATGVLLRVLLAREITFPPLDDPAFYIDVARNLAAGRGFVVDALWSYYLDFPGVTHASNEFWMPLTSIAMAVAIRLFGDVLWAAQLPGMLAGSALVLLTGVIGREGLPERLRWLPLVAALLIAVNATSVYQSVATDSSMLYALLASAALWAALGKVDRRQGPGVARYALAGALTGCAYLARSDAQALAVLIVAVSWLAGWRRVAVYAAFIGGFAIVAGPWWLRNLAVFGTPGSPLMLRTVWITSYEQMFNFVHHAEPADLWALGPAGVAEIRWVALLANLRFYVQATFVWGLIAPAGLWLLRREPLFAVAGLYVLTALLISALVFSMHSASGAYYHAVGALSPYEAVAALYALERGLARVQRPRYRALAAIALLSLSGYQLFAAWQQAGLQHAAWRMQYAEVTDWLHAHAPAGTVIMTSHPYTLLYASGYPSIPLPVAEPPEAALLAARRYGARYLVLTVSGGLYPAALEPPPPGFVLLDGTPGAQIYALDPGAAP